MSHELEIIDGVAQMAYAGETPWHKLGTPVSNDLTPEEMMKVAGLDWSVHEVESFVEFEDKKIATGQKSLIRSTDHSVLTNTGPNWNPVQNAEAFNFFDEYVRAGGMEMHTAGSLKGGKHVWALAKIKESFELFGGDKVDSYLLFSNPHVYGKSIDIRFTPIRVVCNNTLTMSLDSQSKNAAKHGHRTIFNADTVKETLGIATDKFSKYKEMAEFLGSKRFKEESLVQFYNEVFPNTSRTASSEKHVQELKDLSRNAKLSHAMLETQPGAEYAEGTWWQALNSVTFLTDHIQGNNDDNRLHSQWFGHNQTRKVKAAERAVQYALAS